MTITTVSAKGWVVIPKEIRDRYGFYPGRKVRIVDYAGLVSLVPVPDDPVEALYGMFAEGPSLTEELLKERGAELAREEAKIRHWSEKSDQNE